MYKNLRWKLIIIVVVAALAIWAFTPPSQKVKLGLDLRGGVHLVLQVKTDDALRLETETSSEALQEALKTAGITVTAPPPTSATEFEIQGVPPAQDAQFRQIADQQVSVNFEYSAIGSGGYRFRMRPNVVVRTRDSAVQQALQTIDRRVNEFGVTEPNIAPYGAAGSDRIIVELPGVEDVARAKNLIQNTARLEIKLVESGPMSDQAALLSSHGGQVPADMEVVPGASPTPGDTTQVYYLVRRATGITGSHLRNARQIMDEYGLPAVGFTMTNDGATRFGRLTGDNVGRQLAIILDNRVQSAPVIESRIDREGRITGSFTAQQASDLALVLRSGALPASLSYLEESTIGPSLGEDSIRAGIMASITGLVFVTVFMLGYYRLAGINAFVSVALNLIILLGFMAYLGAAMTLPGIAGFILTIGMGVDSNVLIYERIREELANRKTARQAVAAGFDRVFWTIVDTHVASLIAAAFLFQFGTGAIRGFATTLFFGLITNVFTAVFVSRTIFELILSRRPAGEVRLSV